MKKKFRILPPHPLAIEEEILVFQKEAEKKLCDNIPQNFWELSVKEKKKNLPFVFMNAVDYAPATVSFSVLSVLRERAFPFFYEMITRWIIPGRRISSVQTHAFDFRCPEWGDDIFTFGKLLLYVENREVLATIRQNFPSLQQEIRLGMYSAYYARRILSMRGMFPEEKIVHIHEHIGRLAKRLPTYFEHNLFSEMQSFLVLCQEEFKEIRSFHHLSRLVILHYLFRSKLKEKRTDKVLQRRLHRKIFRTELHAPEGNRPVVGLFLGMNFLLEKEIFEEKHFLSAVRAILPEVRVVPRSYFLHRREGELFGTVYLEIESLQGNAISAEEMRSLYLELPNEIEKRIEHLLHPVFMPRNEEEIMRNMLTLANQLRYIRDIPQVLISFDEQTNTSLFYTIILARVLSKKTLSLDEQFSLRRSPLHYIHDRTRRMGTLRKKYPKEATVFRVHLQKEAFLRQNLSIDLYAARQCIVNELIRVLGPVRDFNGGIIEKERKTFSDVERLLTNEGERDRLLMENFFFSMTPIIMRTMVDPEWFRTLFSLLKKTLHEGMPTKEKYTMHMSHDEGKIFLLIQGESFIMKDTLQTIADEMALAPTDYLIGNVWIHDIAHVGFICRSQDEEKKKHLLHRAEEEIEKANIRLKSGARDRMTDHLRGKILYKNHNVYG